MGFRFRVLGFGFFRLGFRDIGKVVVFLQWVKLGAGGYKGIHSSGFEFFASRLARIWA